jgi:hypothetical protein
MQFGSVLFIKILSKSVQPVLVLCKFEIEEKLK